jgi:hypothetical protein
MAIRAVPDFSIALRQCGEVRDHADLSRRQLLGFFSPGIGYLNACFLSGEGTLRSCDAILKWESSVHMLGSSNPEIENGGPENFHHLETLAEHKDFELIVAGIIRTGYDEKGESSLRAQGSAEGAIAPVFVVGRTGI